VLVLLVWIGAVLVAAVVLGFCAYELTWKGKRLQRDLAVLTGMSDSLAALQEQVAAVRRRMNETRH
jgi:hypothetical protein